MDCNLCIVEKSLKTDYSLFSLGENPLIFSSWRSNSNFILEKVPNKSNISVSSFEQNIAKLP